LLAAVRHLHLDPLAFGPTLGLSIWGRPVLTWVAKLQVHAEVQDSSLNRLQTLVANDDNYALAA